jgi:hypothetical protein
MKQRQAPVYLPTWSLWSLSVGGSSLPVPVLSTSHATAVLAGPWLPCAGSCEQCTVCPKVFRQATLCAWPPALQVEAESRRVREEADAAAAEQEAGTSSQGAGM